MVVKIVACLLLLLFTANTVFAATSAATYPTAASTALVGDHSDNDWSDEGNIFGDDGSNASITNASFDSPDQSYIMYGVTFDFSGLPADITIDGVTVKLNAYYADGGVSIDYLYLLDADGAVQGNNAADPAIPLDTGVNDIITEGGAADLWGATLTRAIVNDADWGVAVGVIATGANADARGVVPCLRVLVRGASTLAGADRARWGPPRSHGRPTKRLVAGLGAGSGPRYPGASTGRRHFGSHIDRAGH